jgi:hypothetical protein
MSCLKRQANGDYRKELNRWISKSTILSKPAPMVLLIGNSPIAMARCIDFGTAN